MVRMWYGIPMSKSRKDLEDFELRAPEGGDREASPLVAVAAGGGPLDGGLWLTHEIIREVDDPGLPYLLRLKIGALDGRLAVREAVISRREEGPPVDAIGLRRVAIDRYLRRVLDEMTAKLPSPAVRVVSPPWEAPGGSTWQYQAPPGEADLQRFATIQRHRQSPAELLPKVAEVYRAALADPATARRPSLEVARRLFKSRTHAARLVAMAREAGLLGPAIPGRAGEGASTGEGRL
jgi:hypothetical protein